MIIEDLQTLGLSENEARVYVSLLELGPTTTGPLIVKTGLYRVMVYDILERLLQQGLVTYSLQRNRKHFEAASPDQLLTILHQKTQLARSVVQELQAISTPQHSQHSAAVYEGWQGIRAAQEKYFTALRAHCGEYLMVGASRQLHKKLDAFFNYFHERRAKLDVPAKLLFNENNRAFGLLKKSYKPVHVRFMPPAIVTPSWISTYDDLVLIGVAEEQPMAFLIRNKAVAESYSQYFYYMWRQSTA